MNGLIFTYALTYGGAIVAFFNPFYGLLIYICFAIIKPPALWPWCVPVGSYSKVIGIAVLASWALNGFGDGRLGRAKPIVLCLIGYFSWVLISAVLSEEPSRGLPFVEYLLKIVLPFVAGVTLVRSWQQVKQLLTVVVGSCAFLAYELNLLYLQGFNLEHGKFMGIDNNSFSILMSCSFGLTLVLGFQERRLVRSMFFLGIAAAMAHVPMFSMSRGGMLGTAVAAIVATIVVPKSRRTWMLLILAAALGIRLAGPSVIAEFESSFKEGNARDASAQSRIDLWWDCIDATKHHPIFGVGTECWTLVTESYGWGKTKEAHSLWFQSMAELGIPGVSFLAMFYVLPVYCTREARHLNAVWMPTVYQMMASSLTGFCISAAFVTVEGFELPFYVVLIGAAALKAVDAESAILLPVNHAPKQSSTLSVAGKYARGST